MKAKFTGRWLSSCCGELMDYNQGLCPDCMEPTEPEAEVDDGWFENLKVEANKIIDKAN
jgi:predicted amidophosphoribosyltransferase